jgi:hypothetical protein
VKYAFHHLRKIRESRSEKSGWSTVAPEIWGIIPGRDSNKFLKEGSREKKNRGINFGGVD